MLHKSNNLEGSEEYDSLYEFASASVFDDR